MSALRETKVIIDSKFRQDKNNSQSNYTYLLAREMNSVGQLRLVNVEMARSWFSVDTQNNRIYFTDSGGSGKIAFINPGFLDALELAIQVQAALDAASVDTYVVTYQFIPNSNKLRVVSSNAAFQFNFSVPTGSPARINSAANVIGAALGADVGAAATQDLPNQIDLRHHRYLLIALLSLNTSTGEFPDRVVNSEAITTFMVPVTSVQAKATENFSSSSGFEQILGMRAVANITELQVQILGSDGNEILLNGVDHSLTFAFIQT